MHAQYFTDLNANNFQYTYHIIQPNGRIKQKIKRFSSNTGPTYLVESN